MEPSIEQLRQNYERFDDDKIIRIATQEAAGLRPEALELLKVIIKERGISDDVLKGIDAQMQEIDEVVLHEYTEILRKLPCPICNSSNQKLNATLKGEVISFIIMTNYEKELKIACPDCLDKENNNGMIKSLLLGWWGFPWGIIRTIQSVFFNLKMKKRNRLETPSEYLLGFALENIGRIETARHSPDHLKQIIEHI
jgi:hypothetical protein